MNAVHPDAELQPGMSSALLASIGDQIRPVILPYGPVTDYCPLITGTAGDNVWDALQARLKPNASDGA